MKDIANKSICLKLNKSWQALRVCLVSETIVDLVAGVVDALDIQYVIDADGNPDTSQYDYVNPIGWDEWIKLPVRSWDFAIHTSKMTIRVPTVVISRNYNKMPVKKYRGKPTKEALFHRDGGVDIYTGKEINFDHATIDHILPRSRGGSDTFENTGLTTKEINNGKGNQLNSEIGLFPKFKPMLPRDIPVHHTIRKIRHDDWKFFLTHLKK
jgi:5-methylcytosine-specific restriction endonuclease McrA